MTLLYVGRVMRVDPAGPLVRVPLLGRDALWGPLPSCEAGLGPGEQVVVGQLGASRDQLIILGRLDPTAGGVTGSRLDQVEAAIGDQRVRLTSTESRVAGLVTTDHATTRALGQLRDRLGAVENAATALPAVVALGGDNAAAILDLQAEVGALRDDVTNLQGRVASLEAWQQTGGGATPTASVSAGADVSVTVGNPVNRTATVLTGTVTGWQWRIISGPTGVDSVLSSTDTLSWTPTVAGTYVVAVYGAHAGGTAFDDLTVTAAAAAAPSAPGQVLDLRRWELTMPIAEPGEPSNPLDVYAGGAPNDLNSYTHPSYFRVGSDGDGTYVEFAAPVTGAGMVTTSSESGATRTELREMATLNGGNSGPKAEWTLTDGQAHSITVTLKVDPTGISNGRKELIIGQIHGTGTTPPLYLAANFASTAKITIFKNGPSVADILTGQITAATLFTYRLAKTATNRVQVSYALGTAAALPGTPQHDWPASDFTAATGNYLKVGVYNKTPIDDSDASGVGRVRIYALAHV